VFLHPRLIFAIVTWLVEAVVILLCLRLLPGRARRPDRRYWTDTLLVNAFTNPLANYAIVEGYASFAVIETLVVMVEWPLYRALLRLKWWEGFVVSLVANGVTMAMSFLPWGL
jgi:hypothetical protein